LKLVLEALCFFHPGGSVQLMLCSSHLTSSPLASAAICASVGAGFSTGSLPLFYELVEDDDVEDSLLLPGFSLLLRLQAATTKTSKASGIRFLIGSIHPYLK